MRSRQLLSCLLLLQTKRRTTARELATELDVSMRTVYRDVEALCVAGVPIHMERGPLGGIVLGDDYRKALAHLTPDDLRRLFASGPDPLADLEAGDSRVLQKLSSVLPARAREVAEAARDRLYSITIAGAEPSSRLRSCSGCARPPTVTDRSGCSIGIARVPQPIASSIRSDSSPKPASGISSLEKPAKATGRFAPSGSKAPKRRRSSSSVRRTFNSKPTGSSRSGSSSARRSHTWRWCAPGPRPRGG